MRLNIKQKWGAAGILATAATILAAFGVTAIQAGPPQPLQVAPLAESSPCAAIFLEMAVRGGVSHYTALREAPRNLQDVLDSGMTAYLLPQRADFAYVIDAKGVKAVSYHQPVTTELQPDRDRTIGRGFPAQGLWHETKLPAEHGNPAMKFKVPNFDGAQYLEAGLPLGELADVLRRKHAATHIAHSTLEFLAAAQYERMPADLKELESYIGVPRNPAGWSSIQEVKSRAEVDTAPGNLYYGPVNSKEWVVAVNLGPEVVEYDFAYGLSKKDGWYLGGRTKVFGY